MCVCCFVSMSPFMNAPQTKPLKHAPKLSPTPPTHMLPSRVQPIYVMLKSFNAYQLFLRLPCVVALVVALPAHAELAFDV